VFPEGTRTVGGELLPFKMGFALVAVLTRSPVQTSSSRGQQLLGKGWPLFKKRPFPCVIPCGWAAVPAVPGEDAKHFGAAVEHYFREALSRPGKTIHRRSK